LTGCPPGAATADYVASSTLQAEAFVTLDKALTREEAGAVPFASIEDLIDDPPQIHAYVLSPMPAPPVAVAPGDT
jgi:hypothetical protein